MDFKGTRWFKTRKLTLLPDSRRPDLGKARRWKGVEWSRWMGIATPLDYDPDNEVPLESEVLDIADISDVSDIVPGKSNTGRRKVRQAYEQSNDSAAEQQESGNVAEKDMPSLSDIMKSAAKDVTEDLDLSDSSSSSGSSRKPESGSSSESDSESDSDDETSQRVLDGPQPAI